MQKVIEDESRTDVQPVWEYLIEDDQIDIDALNCLGKQGWELIYTCNQNKLYFKRKSIPVKEDN